MANILTVYYSKKGENYFDGKIKSISKGNTEIIAEMIQKNVGGDIFEIDRAIPYPNNYKECVKESVKEMTGVELTSTLSGQRIFKKEVLEIFDEIPFGYGVEVGMTIDILKHNFKIKEILVNMTHSETGRDLKGFIHRGKQFYHIKKVVRQKKKEWR